MHARLDAVAVQMRRPVVGGDQLSATIATAIEIAARRTHGDVSTASPKRSVMSLRSRCDCCDRVSRCCAVARGRASRRCRNPGRRIPAPELRADILAPKALL